MQNYIKNSKFFSYFSFENILVFLSCLTVLGLIYSRFLLSLSMFLWLIASLKSKREESIFQHSVLQKVTNYFTDFFKNKDFIVVTLFFFTVLISGFWSEDMRYFSERLRIRLPFLLMPLAFAWLVPISKKIYHTTFYFLIALLSLTMIGVLVHYSQDFEAINESLLRGKNIPVPMNHIRFSLLLAFSTIVGFILWKKEDFDKQWKKNSLMASIIFLFASLHILAVRSGIACFYLTVIMLGVRYIFLSKKYFLIVALLVFSIGIPSLSYVFFPSIKKKVEYAFFDFEQFRAGNGANYSDAERIGSIMAGLKVGNDSPILGCGYGDLEKEVSIAYKEVFPQEKEPKIPHNQYIMTYAGLGTIGLFIFLFAYLFPIFYKKNYQEPIFLALNIITGLSFMVEGTIETQVGTAFYVYFLCLGLNYLKNVQSSQRNEMTN